MEPTGLQTALLFRLAGRKPSVALRKVRVQLSQKWKQTASSWSTFTLESNFSGRSNPVTQTYAINGHFFNFCNPSS